LKEQNIVLHCVVFSSITDNAVKNAAFYIKLQLQNLTDQEEAGHG